MQSSSKNGNSSNPEKNYGDRLAEERTNLANLRTLMAVERTFAAWIRTGLAGVAGGLAFTHFLSFKTPWHQYASYIIGVLLILWGIAIFIYSSLSYNASVKRLDKDAKWQSHPIRLEFLCGALILLALFALLISIQNTFLT